MTVHLIKLCVGCDSVRELEDWIKEKLKAKRKNGEKPEHIHRTRMVPTRAADVKPPWYSLDHIFVMESGEARLPKPPITGKAEGERPAIPHLEAAE